MQSHELKVTTTSRKRVGRGGKRGTYSGAGMKGQKARSGGSVKPLFEGGRSSLVMRMKKLRGFTSPHAKRVVVGLDILETHFAAGDTVSVATLIEKKLLRKKDFAKGIRLVSGELTKKLTIDGTVSVSMPAQKLIENVGGTVIEPEVKLIAQRKVPIEKK